MPSLVALYAGFISFISRSFLESSDVADGSEAKTVHTAAPSLSIDSVPEESADETGAKTLSEEKEFEDSRHSIVSVRRLQAIGCAASNCFSSLPTKRASYVFI